jgi:hypothetical protein
MAGGYEMEKKLFLVNKKMNIKRKKLKKKCYIRRKI